MNKIQLPLALISLLAVSSSADGIVHFDTPKGGWRTGDKDKTSYTQTVAYPAASVNVSDDQSMTARIRGSIEGRTKTVNDPATLIVNGIAMPLRVEESGQFDRPYIFSPGSNGVEVRDGPGQATGRVQFFHQASEQTPAALRVILSWDSDNTDLDIHVITPDGQHAWYGNRVLTNGAAQDVDVTTGYGPEIFSSPTPLLGQYLVYVNYYGGGYNRDESAQDLTLAQVTVITQEGTINEKHESLVVPMRKPGELTLVKRFSYP